MIQFLVAAPCSGSGKTTLTCPLAGGNALPGGQDTGKKPCRFQHSKGRKLLGPGGKQNISLRPGQKSRRMGRRGKHHAPGRQRAFGPEQAAVLRARCFAGCPDVPGGLHSIRMGRVHAEVSPLQQGGHLLRGQPPAVDGDAGPFALFLGPQRGGHADQYLGPQCGQLL